jgi:hypothetical protein
MMMWRSDCERNWALLEPICQSVQLVLYGCLEERRSMDWIERSPSLQAGNLKRQLYGTEP